MYLKYWGLKNPPFNNVPSETCLFRSPQHEEALSRLRYMVDHRKGVAMLTGEVGCGKTTVTKALLNSLDRDEYQFQLLPNPAMEPLDLLRAVLINFGEQTVNGSKPVLLARLQERLIHNATRGITTILAIDEAHVINNQETLDELRMLLNMQQNEQFLITLILLGQPPLLNRIAEHQPLRERIGVKFNLGPLDAQDTLRYIMCRLKNAGAERGFFTSEAIAPLYEYSGGIPLRINNVCDRCLLIGFMQRSWLVDTRIVAEAIDDLQ